MKNLSVILFLLVLISTNIKAQESSSTKSNFMIRHTVVFKLNYPKGSPEEIDFFNAASKLAEIPGVYNFETLLQTGKKNDFEYCFSMEFKTMQAYDEYNQHPVHTKFVETYWVNYVEKFLELDYEAVK